jgi:hypothetical protein
MGFHHRRRRCAAVNFCNFEAQNYRWKVLASQFLKEGFLSDLIFSVLQDFNKTPVKISGRSPIANGPRLMQILCNRTLHALVRMGSECVMHAQAFNFL